MNKKEVKKAPALRFKGFTNDWEQRKLGYEVNFYSGLTYHPDDIRNSGVFVIRSSNIKNNRLISADNVFVNPQIVNSKPVHINDIVVVVRNGSRKLIGKHVLIQHELHDTVIGAFMTGIRSSNNFFINATLDSQLFKKEIQKNLGSTINQITVKNFQNMVFGFPSKIEKDKIGKLFRIIDNIISLQQRKLELLKASKKAVLQNIFTDTKRVPTIRFNTFSENWNQKRLKPFLIKYNKKTTVNNQYPVLTSSRQGLFFQKDYYDGNQIASKNNIGYNIVPRNYFTYRHMSDDLIFHFNINTICDYGIVSTLYPVFTTTSEIDSQWLLYYLNHSVDIKKYALLQKQGGSRTYMYFSKLESLKAHIPALAEQKKISSLIFKIDEQIYFQQKKLKYLQKSKQFLLQNMFI